MVNTILKEADLFCPNSVRINFTIYQLKMEKKISHLGYSLPASRPNAPPGRSVTLVTKFWGLTTKTKKQVENSRRTFRLLFGM
ncbi:Aspartate aminotransferase [Levilactobacillus zymae]|uniref:Aspartate aminotransferase n=1 Tax=Levilactobacillus zymae TaxID=267363 RepID=A0A1Y6JWR3_9LACO|nr:Aspartate aminotransferase [Levilactobacillus zymae]